MRARHPWWLPLAAGFGAVFARVLAATWRYTVRDAPEYTAAVARGERFVYAFWHSGLLPLSMLHCDEGIAVLVSRHRDGELITRVIEHLGYVAARGSSTRGGEAGVRGMLSWAAQDRQLAVTPDGPRGPAERVKPGALYLAERTGRRMVPIGFAAHPVLALRSWDRFRIPWPFARVLVSHGAPFEPAARPAAQAAGVAGAESPNVGAPGTAAAAPERGLGTPAVAAEAATAGSEECARLAFERALDAITRDLRTRMGDRL